MVEYLGCCPDTIVIGESMAMKSARKINTKLQFLNSYIDKMSF